MEVKWNHTQNAVVYENRASERRGDMRSNARSSAQHTKEMYDAKSSEGLADSVQMGTGETINKGIGRANADSPAACLELSSAMPAPLRWLEQLKGQYSELWITVEEKGAAGTAQAAAARGNAGINLVISREFVDKWSQNEEMFEWGQKIIEDLVSQLIAGKQGASGMALASESRWVSVGAYVSETGVVYWAKKEQQGAGIFSANEEKGNRAANTKSTRVGGKLKISVSADTLSVSGVYTQMAQARDRFQVLRVISKANQSIGQLALVTALGDDKERRQAAAAIRSLKKLLVRGRKKIKSFDRQETLTRQKQRAIEQQQKQKAAQIEKELKKLKRERRNEDRRLMEDGRGEDSKIQRIKGRTTAREQQLEQQAAAVTAAQGTGAVPDGASIGTAEVGGVTIGGEIAMSEEIAF